MEVYSVEEDDLRRISDSDLEYEENLEEHLLKSRGAEIGGVKLFYVSRQEPPDEGGIFDILGIDEDGDIVVVELKRGKAPRTAVAQALEYASGIRNESYDVLNERYERFLRHLGET